MGCCYSKPVEVRHSGNAIIIDKHNSPYAAIELEMYGRKINPDERISMSPVLSRVKSNVI